MTAKTKMVQDSFEELSAYIVLRGCDKAKYKSLVKGFVNQFSLKNNQYPKTVQNMTDALSKHPFDDDYHKRQRNKAKQRRQAARNRNNTGNQNNNNNNDNDDDDENGELSFAQAAKSKKITHATNAERATIRSTSVN